MDPQQRMLLEVVYEALDSGMFDAATAVCFHRKYGFNNTDTHNQQLESRLHRCPTQPQAFFAALSCEASFPCSSLQAASLTRT